MIKITKNAELAPLSTFDIGGQAEYLCEVRTPGELMKVAEFAEKAGLPARIFAGGSNIVFPDGKLKGLTIHIKGGKILVKGRIFIAEAGADLAAVVSKSINLGLSGLETLSGIPGTLGGAIVGNAGAYGHSISETVKRVEIWDPFGAAQGKRKTRWLKNSECRFGYRESVFKHKSYLVLRVELGFKKGNRENLKKISKNIIKLRGKKYRPGLKCPGSFFKNILLKDIGKNSLKLVENRKIIDGKIPAGYLLEEAGAKGMKIGGIKVADFHGNLVMNAGGGKAKDVKKLARILKAKVRRKFGIKLEEEIRYF